MSTSFIYTLRENGSSEVRYVGQTQYPKHRFYSYDNGNDIKNLIDSNPRKQWLSELASRGAGIEMEVIEECSLSIVTERERHWVTHFRSLGHRLTNKSMPGNSPSERMRSLKRNGFNGEPEIIPASLFYRSDKPISAMVPLFVERPVEDEIYQDVECLRMDFECLRHDVDLTRREIDGIKRLLYILCEKLGIDSPGLAKAEAQP